MKKPKENPWKPPKTKENLRKTTEKHQKTKKTLGKLIKNNRNKKSDYRIYETLKIGKSENFANPEYLEANLATSDLLTRIGVL